MGGLVPKIFWPLRTKVLGGYTTYIGVLPFHVIIILALVSPHPRLLLPSVVCLLGCVPAPPSGSASPCGPSSPLSSAPLSRRAGGLIRLVGRGPAGSVRGAGWPHEQQAVARVWGGW